MTSRSGATSSSISTDPPEDWAESLERGEAARGTASKDPDDPAGGGRSPSRRSPDDAGEDDEDEDEPEPWRDDA